MAEIDEMDETTWYHHSETFHCTPQEFYRAMTTKSTVVAFMLSDCKVEGIEGGTFNLFDIEGYFVKLVPDESVTMRWRLKTWQSDYFSEVVIIILEKNDLTEIHLLYKDLSEEEVENTSEAWQRVYWENIRATFDSDARSMYLVEMVERQG